MSVNRYYNPSRGQYVSQFVPNELPADMLLKGVLSRRQVEDKQQDLVTKLLDWDMEVLQGDLADKNKKKMEARAFADDLFGKEFSAPENVRKYKEFVRKFQDDTNIPAWEKNLSLVKAIQEEERKMKIKGGDSYDPAQWADITRRVNQYNQNGGFRGTGMTFEKYMGEEGMNLREKYEKAFDHIKEDKIETARRVNDFDYGLYAKYSKEGISPEKIKDAVKKQVFIMYNGAEGRHHRRREISKILDQMDPSNTITEEQLLNSMSSQEREEFEAAIFESFKDDLTNVGKTFVNKKISDNTAEIKNKAAGWNREDLIKEGVPIVTTSDLVLGSTTDLSWEKKQENIRVEIAKAQKNIADMKANPQKYVTVTSKGWEQQLNSLIKQEQNKIKSYQKQDEEIRTEKRNAYNTIKNQVFSAEELKLEKDIEKERNQIIKESKALVGKNLSREELNKAYAELERRERAVTQKRNILRQKYATVNEEWNKYLSSEKSQVRQYQITDNLGEMPTMKGLTTTLNSGAQGFSIQTIGANGKVSSLPKSANSVEIIIDENNKRIVPLTSLTDFKMTGVISGDWNGRGTATKGTAYYNMPITNEKTGKVTYQKVPVSVIVTQKKEATESNMFSLANELTTKAKKLEASGNAEGAYIARNEAIKLSNPVLNQKLVQLEKSGGTMKAHTIPINVKLGENVKTAEVKVEKTNSGLYKFNIIDAGKVVGGSEGKLVTHGEMVNYLLKVSVE